MLLQTISINLYRKSPGWPEACIGLYSFQKELLGTARMKRIMIISNNAGGGHKASAEALREGITRRSLGFEVTHLNFYSDIVGSADDITYNNILRLGLAPVYWPVFVPLARIKFRLCRSQWVRNWIHILQKEKPDAVVSVIPFVNDILKHGIDESDLDIPFITACTDYKDIPSNYWIQNRDQFYIAPTEDFTEQAINLGIPTEQIHQSRGMILRPEFYDEESYNKEKKIRELGLHPHRPIALVFFGGSGSKDLLKLARKLNESGLSRIQFIFMCGGNESVKRKIQRKTGDNSIAIGFTKDFKSYLSIADFTIGKPGPGFVFESLALEKPVIVVSNWKTMRQEKAVAEYVKSRKVGIVVSSIHSVSKAILTMINVDEAKKISRSIKRLNNNGLEDAVDGLLEILRVYNADRHEDSLEITRKLVIS